MSFDESKLEKYYSVKTINLQDLFVAIKHWQLELGYDYDEMSSEERLKQFKNYYIALSMEQAELLQELPWKPWRPIEGQYKGLEMDIMKEWIDCLFFLVDQALCLQLDPERLAQMFYIVLNDNLNRIKIGYNSDKGKL